MRYLLSLLLIAVLTVAAAARPTDLVGSIGHSLGFSGSFPIVGGIGSGAAPPADCASPTAPDGSIDLSQCSNTWYVATIL